MKFIVFILSFILYMNCTSFSDGIPEKTPIVSIVETDSDCDGVPDAQDKCPGGDDTVDNDNDGNPDCIDPPTYAQVDPSWKCGVNKVVVCSKSAGGFKKICTYYSAIQNHLKAGGFLGPCINCNQ